MAPSFESILAEREAKRRALKIIIDFGTVFSAVAFRDVGMTHGLLDIDPGKLTINDIHVVVFDGEDQVRTQLAWYNEEQKWLWGQEVDEYIQQGELPESSRIEYFKLGLDTSQHTANRRKRLQEQLDALPEGCEERSVVQLHMLFFERLFAYAKQSIQTTFNQQLSGDIFEEAYVSCVICIPAMWSSSLRNTVLTLAQQTGIPNVDFISEPEAASTFIIHQELRPFSTNQESVRTEINRGGPFLVADIGGGTGVSQPL